MVEYRIIESKDNKNLVIGNFNYINKNKSTDIDVNLKYKKTYVVELDSGHKSQTTFEVIFIKYNNGDDSVFNKLSSVNTYDLDKYDLYPEEMNLSFKDKETYERVLKMLKDLYKKHYEEKHTIYKFYKFSSRNWQPWKGRHLNAYKTFENCIYRSSIEDDIITKMDKWKSSKDVYMKRGLPYKIGFLFHGIPGTGKSSMAYCLSNKYNMDIYEVSIDIVRDKERKNIIGKIPNNSIILFDDVDLILDNCNRLMKDKDKKDKKDDEDSKMINLISNNELIKFFLEYLDGNTYLNDSVVIFTTNNADVIDTAIKRPGRIDHTYCIGYCDDGQIERLCKLYEKNYKEIISSNEFKREMKEFGGITPATLVKKFLV